MKNKVIKLISLVMMLIVTSSVFGCTDKNDNKVTETRYSEEEMQMPDFNNVYDLKYINDQINLLGSDSNNTLVKCHNFDKDTWKNETINIHYNGKISDDDSSLQALMNDKSIEKYSPIDGTLSDEGNIAYIDYEKDQEKDKEIKDYNINIYTLDRKTIPIDISREVLDSLSDITYLNSKDLFAISQKKIYQYNGETGKLKFQYNFDKGDIISQCYIDNNLYVVTSGLVEKYDITTGKKVGDIDSLKEYIDSNTKIFKGIGTNMLIRNSKGLFNFRTNDEKMEKILDGSSTSIGDSSLDVEKVIEYSSSNTSSKYEFLVLYRDRNNNKYSLCKYTYSEKLSNKELTEVKVYSLYENANINQIARRYQKNNEDIKINYEFGIGFYGGITEDDALKKLNTEIMAGKGPDILFLDGMSYDYYENKGILENLDDVVDENKDNLFSSITNSFYKGNKIYMIPLHIRLPMIMGKDTVVKDAEDLETLSNSIESNLKDQDVDIIKIYNPEDIINLMYFSSSSDFIDGKKLNQDSIKSFLESAKKIYDVSKDKINKNEYKLYNESSSQYKEQYGDNYGFSRNYFLIKPLAPNDLIKKNTTNLELGYINSLVDVSKILGTVNNRDDISYKYFSGNGQKLFLPLDIVSVNSKSKNKKLAKEIVSDMLKEEYFSSDTQATFSINKKVLDNIFVANKDNTELGGFGVGDEEGEVEIQIKWLDQENYNYILDTINSLEKSVDTKTIVLDSIIDYGEKYILGEISINDALNKISKDIEIKLEE
ncbi:MAG: hypothetical protein GX275_09665 [Clostridiales bacterium]|nr:hypothetical protein [Clostridiales bacterium]